MSDLGAIGAAPIVGLASAPRRPDTGAALREFEGYFLGEMLRAASRPVQQGGLLDGGSAGRMYREMHLQEIARIVAERSALGLARELESGVAALGGGGEGIE